MKTINRPSASKVTMRYDRELMNILMNDLKARKIKQQFLNTQRNAA
ncbi:MAG: hypothetical protein ACTHNW_06715 [Mucilaginibacter sp.]